MNGSDNAVEEEEEGNDLSNQNGSDSDKAKAEEFAPVSDDPQRSLSDEQEELETEDGKSVSPVVEPPRRRKSYRLQAQFAFKRNRNQSNAIIELSDDESVSSGENAEEEASNGEEESKESLAEESSDDETQQEGFSVEGDQEESANGTQLEEFSAESNQESSGSVRKETRKDSDSAPLGADEQEDYQVPSPERLERSIVEEASNDQIDASPKRWFLQRMPWLKAFAEKDGSYISWCYKTLPSMKLVAQNFPRMTKFATKLITNEPHFKVYKQAENLYIPYDRKVNSEGRRVMTKEPIVESVHSTTNDVQDLSQTHPNVQALLSDTPSSSTSDWHFTIVQIIHTFENLFKNNDRRVQSIAQPETTSQEDQTTLEQELQQSSADLSKKISMLTEKSQKQTEAGDDSFQNKLQAMVADVYLKM